MEKDFLNSLASAGYTARIKRISDSLMYDARRVYAEIDLDIEPNWHLIFLLLKQEKTLSVTEIADVLGFSHPAIIKIVKKMKAKGYLDSRTDPNDSRKQLMELSSKAKQKLPEFEKEWNHIKTVIENIIDSDMARLLTQLEEKLRHTSLLETYRNSIK